MHGHQGRYPNIPEMYENLSLKTYHFGNVKFLTDGNNIFRKECIKENITSPPHSMCSDYFAFIPHF